MQTCKYEKLNNNRQETVHKLHNQGISCLLLVKIQYSKVKAEILNGKMPPEKIL